MNRTAYHVTLTFLLMCFSVVFLMRLRLRLKPNFCLFLILFSFGILANKCYSEILNKFRSASDVNVNVCTVHLFGKQVSAVFT